MISVPLGTIFWTCPQNLFPGPASWGAHPYVLNPSPGLSQTVSSRCKDPQLAMSGQWDAPDPVAHTAGVVLICMSYPSQTVEAGCFTEKPGTEEEDKQNLPPGPAKGCRVI